MKEFLPLLLGCGIGVVFVRLPQLPRAAWPAACIVGGALASLINGELNEAFWALFVSFDAALVWIGASVTTALFWSVKRRPSSST